MSRKRVHAACIGDALRVAREALGLTQSSLSAKADLHRNAVVAVEAGRGHVATLLALAAKLDLELSGRGLAGSAPLGERLLNLRKKRRLSRRTVAAMAGVSVPAIEGMERTSSGHVATLEALGRAIGAGLCLVPAGVGIGFWEGPASSSASAEWYTPRWLLDRVTDAVGQFDLDPCSPGRGRSEVDARLHLTVHDDGLALPWFGTVWLNPPYGPAVGTWLAKARSELAAGNARKVLALIAARTDTRWWHDNIAGAADILMLKGRITFIGADAAAPFPSALVAFGLPEAERDALFRAFPGAWHVAMPRKELSQPFLGVDAMIPDPVET